MGFVSNEIRLKTRIFQKQEIIYIEGYFNFKKAIVTPTIERTKKKLVSVLTQIVRVTIKQKIFLHLLVIIACCLELNTQCAPFYEAISTLSSVILNPSSSNLEALIPVTHHLKLQLQWWLTQPTQCMADHYVKHIQQ